MVRFARLTAGGLSQGDGRHRPGGDPARARALRSGVPSLDGNAYGVFQPLGDFEPPASAAGHPLGDVGAALPELDPAARAIVVDVTERDRRWQGEVGIGQAEPIDLLLLPTLTSCALSHTLDAGARTGPALAAVGSERVLVVGGVASTPPRTLLVRLDTGEIQPVSPDLLTPRSGASVTTFGPGALVAGGFDSRNGARSSTGPRSSTRTWEDSISNTPLPSARPAQTSEPSCSSRERRSWWAG